MFDVHLYIIDYKASVASIDLYDTVTLLTTVVDYKMYSLQSDNTYHVGWNDVFI
jgi:hypothetical protein